MSERALATFVADLTAEAIPDDVRDKAGLTVADTIGAVVGGSTDPAVQSLARRWGETTSGTATVLGSDGTKTGPTFAAFCNGAAGTVLELDEGHRFAAGHPAIHVLPALLAAAEADYGNDDTFLESFVAGYEAAVRVARATAPLAEGYHPHGVWGPVGGAAAVAHHRKLDAELTHAAMSIAANYAQHTQFAAATEGATVRNGYAGMSNLASLVAVDQAEAGFTGLDDGVARHLGLAAAGDVETAALIEGLGERWELLRGYFKLHAACRYTHPVLDAVEQLDDGVDPGDVDGVTVETYPAAAQLSERSPGNSLQAKFSIPFAVATGLVTGETGPTAFADDAITPEVRAVAERVDVSVGEEFAARAPEKRGARVTVDLGAETVSAIVDAPRGSEHDPVSESELEAKFRSLTAPVIGNERSGALWESARSLKPPRVICTLAQR